MAKNKDLISKGTYVEYYPNEESGVVCAIVKSASTDEVLTRGFSRCEKDDTFDLEFGKKVARIRAYKKLCEKYIKIFDKKIQELFDSVALFNDAMFEVGVERDEYDVALDLLIEEKYPSKITVLDDCKLWNHKGL